MTVADQLRESLVYETNADAQSITADIATMTDFDRENEKIERRWLFVGCAGLFLIAVGAVLFFLMVEQGSGAVGAVIGVVGLVTAIVGFVLKMRAGRFNLEDMRYLALERLVRLLKTDMKDGESFQARISFREHNEKSNFVRSGPAGQWKAKFYQHPWLMLGGRFLDGAKFQITVTEKQQDRHRSKISASGKHKTKYKTKNSGEALVTLKFKEKRYPHFSGQQADMHQALQLPDGVMVKSLEVSKESLALRVRYDSEFAVGNDQAKARRYTDLTASMLLSCYHLLNQSRRPSSQ